MVLDRLIPVAVQSESGRYHNEHHRKEDADGSKACTVTLHPVCHRRDGYKVTCLIVIVLILLKYPAQEDRTGDQGKICADDNEYYRYEEPGESRQRLLYLERDDVSCSEECQSEYS